MPQLSQLCGLYWAELGGLTLQVRTTGSLLSNALTLELGGGNNVLVPCRDHHVTVCVFCYVSLFGTCGITCQHRLVLHRLQFVWCCTGSNLFHGGHCSVWPAKVPRWHVVQPAYYVTHTMVRDSNTGVWWLVAHMC
jgi:hypothetical protein